MFQKKVKDLGLIQSMSKGKCWDNAYGMILWTSKDEMEKVMVLVLTV
jgi:hypothetical protein